MKSNSTCYTIKFSKSGINQYADFRVIDGILINPTLRVSYVKMEDTPNVSQVKTLKEVLSIIKEFSYSKRVEIYLVNHVPKNYHANKKAQKAIPTLRIKFKDFLTEQSKEFFTTFIEPIVKKHKWTFTNNTNGCVMALIYKDSQITPYTMYLFLMLSGNKEIK